ncbi:general transcription factor IIH subunit 5 [Acanthopagrus latus]|nr:general transcription factor IIH subunit 5 [Acanthopagrus latus]
MLLKVSKGNNCAHQVLIYIYIFYLNRLLFSVPDNMVNVHKGVLVECDPAMKQFLLFLDEKMALGKKFILKDLDDTHVFILQEVVQTLQERVGELMDQNSFPITQK